jgi:tetratricopeptide (TPR) repeat protein
MVFTGDGKTMAIAFSRTLVRLIDPATGQELATLPTVGGPCCFTPDGDYLVTVGQGQTIQLWDLRRIRTQLATMDLDWDPPPNPLAEVSAAAQLLQVKVDLGCAFDLFPDPTCIGLNSLVLALNPWNFDAHLQRGRAFARQGESENAIADYTMALFLMPSNHKSYGEMLFRRNNNYRRLNDLTKAHADLQTIADLDLDVPVVLRPGAAEQCKTLAWLYVTGQEKQRDPQKALTLVKKAIALAPDNCTLLNTLGVVQYRLGQYAEAEETLERSLRESKGEEAAFDLFFLAMCHARRGELVKAQELFNRAVQWAQEHEGKLQPDWKRQLDALRAEAEAFLQNVAKP